MSKQPEYPFEPRSTRYMRPGQFWAVPLSDGRFACGRVLQLSTRGGRTDSRMFLAGLMDWCGESLPTSSALAGCGVTDQGMAHVRTIQETGRKILGERALEMDGLVLALHLNSRQRGAAVLRGLEQVGTADQADLAQLPVLTTWGYRFIKRLAERRFGRAT